MSANHKTNGKTTPPDEPVGDLFGMPEDNAVPFDLPDLNSTSDTSPPSDFPGDQPNVPFDDRPYEPPTDITTSVYDD